MPVPAGARVETYRSITCVRTTLVVDDDVLDAVRERARREHRSIGAVLSDLARQSLNGRHAEQRSEAEPARYGFRPLPHRAGTVSNALIDRLRDDESV